VRGSQRPAGPLCSDLMDVSAGVLGLLGQGVKERPFRVLSRTPGQELKEAGVSFHQVTLALCSPDRATNPLNMGLAAGWQGEVLGEFKSRVGSG